MCVVLRVVHVLAGSQHVQCMMRGAESCATDECAREVRARSLNSPRLVLVAPLSLTQYLSINRSLSSDRLSTAKKQLQHAPKPPTVVTHTLTMCSDSLRCGDRRCVMARVGTQCKGDLCGYKCQADQCAEQCTGVSSPTSVLIGFAPTIAPTHFYHSDTADLLCYYRAKHYRR
jgi:hypothetical protein